MKIDHLNQLQPFNHGSNRLPVNRGDVSFRDLLSQTLSCGQNQTAAPLLSPPAAAPFFITPPVPDETLQRQAMSQARKLLASLDNYQALLADPAVSLKRVSLGVDRLENEIRQTAPMLDELPSDGPLQDILQSLSSLALVETVKFRRGDYSQ